MIYHYCSHYSSGIFEIIQEQTNRCYLYSHWACLRVRKSNFPQIFFSPKGLGIHVILEKSVDMSSVNIGNVYIGDISEQTHFPIGLSQLFINRE